MRYIITFLFALIFSGSAFADRVVEVQNIRVERQEYTTRDAAVTEATRLAVENVWKQLASEKPLPALSAQTLQGITSYVDITNEISQSNYYLGTFNIGIRTNKLPGFSETSLSSPTQPFSSNSAITGRTTQPRWVLVIPAHEIGNSVTLWNPVDPWQAAWVQTTPSGISTAVANGDNKDQSILSADMISSNSANISSALQQLATKYGAPAVALAVLSSPQDKILPNMDVDVEITYLDGSQQTVTTTQRSFAATTENSATPLGGILSQSKQTLTALINGDSNALSPSLLPPLTSASESNATTTYTPQHPQAISNTTKLWVRIPLATPQDFSHYRNKILSIPGAKFEVTAMNRLYVEGNILYTGSQEQLYSELAAKGLRQQ